MNAQEYRRKSKKPDSFPVQDLKDTRRVLQRERAPELVVVERALAQGPLEKPPLHEQPDEAEFCVVKCSGEEAEAIVNYLFDAEASAVPASGESTPEANRLARLVDRWTRLREHLDEYGA